MAAPPRPNPIRTRLLAAALTAAAGLPMLGGPAAGATDSMESLVQRHLAEHRESRAHAAATFRPPEGSFVQFENWVFEIVGGAPIYVSNWAAVGGRKPVTRVSESQWAALPDQPANGTFVTASDGRVYRFVAGVPFYVSSWTGFGTRPSTLRIDAAAIQRAGSDNLPWDRVNNSPADAEISVQDTGTTADPQVTVSLNGGIFVRGATTGRVYRLVGGAAIYVSSWTPFGGQKPAVTVDQVTIDRAGQTGPWRFLRRYPLDGWLVKGSRNGQTFSIAGGAPIYVSTQNILTQGDPGHVYLRRVPATVDQALIDRTGNPAPYNSLRTYPANGTVLYAVRSWQDEPLSPDASLYQVHDGYARPTTSGALAARTDSFTYVPVDQHTLDRAGQAAPYSHLKSAV